MSGLPKDNRIVSKYFYLLKILIKFFIFGGILKLKKMNTLKNILILFTVSLLFVACEKCETCTLGVIEYTWNDGLSQEEIDAQDAIYQDMGYADAQAYYDEMFSALAVSDEYCDDDLDVIKAEDDVDVAGFYTYGWTCVE